MDYNFIIKILFPNYIDYIKTKEKSQEKKESKENLEFKKLYNSIKSRYPNLSHQEILLRIRSAKLEKERREKDLNSVSTNLNSEVIQTADKLINSVKKEKINSQETVFKVDENSDNFKSFEDFLFNSYDSREGIVEEYSGKDSIEGYTGI